MPTLILDDGRPLAESNAILCYFAEDTAYLPRERYDRTRVLQWLFFEQYSHEPHIAMARFWLKYAAEKPPAETIARRQRAGYAALDAIEGHLGSREFLVGGRYTIADIALYAYTHVADEGGFELAGYPAIGRWLERVADQPGHTAISD